MSAAQRDLPVAVGQQWPFGATTVSASVSFAAAAGVSVFATGGIGGVHRGAEVAAVLANGTRARSGVLVGVPIPEADELDPAELDAVLIEALAERDAAGITGAAITPFVLDRIGDATDGRSVPVNLALAENNARVAAEIAVAVAERHATS